MMDLRPIQGEKDGCDKSLIAAETATQTSHGYYISS